MTCIRLSEVGLVYRRYTTPRAALWEWICRRPQHEVFHALQGVSFALEPNQALGIIGDNGAGKSTLLKVLSGNLLPTSGSVEVVGKRAALLELGAGLQPEFSGWENARLGLALRGYSPARIQALLPEVIAFAELESFADQPLKTYSSGMAVRLAFAVAVADAPDVLIVDEALSVGDQYFQKKSLDRMRTILNAGATLVFCSHNLYQVRELCTHVVWLEAGCVKAFGDAQTVVDAYQNAQRARHVDAVESGFISQRNMPQLLDVALNKTEFVTREAWSVTVQIHLGQGVWDDVHVGIVVRRNDDVQCFGMSTAHDGVMLQFSEAGVANVTLSIAALPLLSGDYCLEVWLVDKTTLHVYDARPRCCYFHVTHTQALDGVGMFSILHQWAVQRGEQHALAVG